MDVHGYTESGSIEITIDEVRMTVPDDMGNRHRQMIEEWVEAGNTIPPYTPPPPTEADYENAIQNHLDAAAQARKFKDGFALASYSTSTKPAWAAEANAYIAWRDATWTYVYEQLAAVQAGERTIPTIAELIAELPVADWP